MSRAIEITRLERGAGALRELAGKCRDGAVVRRLLAIALLLEGHSRASAAEMNGMTRQTLRDWVHRYNAEGVDGLSSRVGGGRPPVLSDAQMAEFRELVINGPDAQRHGVVRWRCVDLCGEVARRWSVTVCEQTVGRWLHELGLTRLQPRPYHPQKDPEAEAAFKKTSPSW